MAKIETRLPFLRPAKPQAYEKNVYIIPESDRKLVDYEVGPESLKTHRVGADVVRSDPIKRVIGGIRSPTSKMVAPSSGLKTPASGLQKPSVLVPPKSCGAKKRFDQPEQSVSSTKTPAQHSTTDSTSAVVPASKTIADPKSTQITLQTNSIKKSEFSESARSCAVVSKEAPTIPPKPCLPSSDAKKTKPSTPTKISQPNSISKLSPPGQQLKQSNGLVLKPQSKMSKTGLSQSMSKLKALGSEKLSSPANSVPKFSTTQTSSSHNESREAVTKRGSSHQKSPSPVKETPVRHQSKPGCVLKLPAGFQKTMSSANEQCEKLSNSEQSKSSHENRQKSPATLKIGGVSKGVSRLQKPGTQPRLMSPSGPSKIFSGLKKPSTVVTGLSSKALAPSNIRQCNPGTLIIPLVNGTTIPPVTIDQCLPSQYLSLGVTSSISFTQNASLHYALASDEQTTLTSAAPISSTTIISAQSEVNTVDFEQCSIDKAHTFCGPSITVSSCSDLDEVFETEPVTADAEVSQCYSYLQQATLSSYRKQLVNSFAIAEQLSPTAESHARHIADSLPADESQPMHIADSLPQPWLSVDFIDNNNSGECNRKLIIPDPPLDDSNKPKLQVIDEVVEPVAEVCTKKTWPSFSSAKRGESIDDAIAKDKESETKPSLKSPSVLGNFFSKIGGRRILSRPQESPPRVRKSTAAKGASGLATASSRRKLSPKLRRREGKSIR